MIYDFPSAFGETNIDSAFHNYVLYGLDPGSYVSRSIVGSDDAFSSLHPIARIEENHSRFVEIINATFIEPMLDIRGWNGIVDSEDLLMEYASNAMKVFEQSGTIKDYLRNFRICLHQQRHSGTLAKVSSVAYEYMRLIDKHSQSILGPDIRILT